MIIFVSSNPEDIINQQELLLLAGNHTQVVFAIQFSFEQYYLTEPKNIDLISLVQLKKTANNISISAAIFPLDSAIKSAIEQLDTTDNDLQIFSNNYQTPWLTLSAPLMLEPVKIPKPWGQEIWYTGIEARGQSNVTAQGFSTPLSWLLALMSDYLADNQHKKIILLKTLDPLPDEVYGDLYFELHEQKQEVYVVTHIDSRAWKNNIGAIRLGFDEKKRSEFKNDEEFKVAYLNAVSEYEKIRRTIDGLYDIDRIKNNIALTSLVDVEVLRSWAKKIPKELVEREEQARDYKNSFSAIQPLRIGDVVKVPCYVPHALQHGVRVVEFQTPVYERKILSFAQKVLTQDSWDTQVALEKAQLVMPEQTALVVLSAHEGVLVEEVARFDDFRVISITLAANQQYCVESQDSYGLLMPIGNVCGVLIGDDQLSLAAEEVMFIPYKLLAGASRNKSLIVCSKEYSLQVLLAVVV